MDMVLEDGARVMVEAYNVDLHGILADEQAVMKDGWHLIRRGAEVVCIGVI
jgi:hypothetical protein